MRYNAIVFRPFKGEVFDAEVKTVNKLGVFAQVGLLQVFISKHLMPPDMKFDPQSTPAAYVSDVDDGQPQRVTKDSQVRLPDSLSALRQFDFRDRRAQSGVLGLIQE